MKMSKVLRQKLKEAKKTDQYWMDAAKLDFAIAIERQRKVCNLTYAEVAAAIQTSPAYVSKVFRGDANLTIESMVKLVRKLGCNLDIRLEEISKVENAYSFWTEGAQHVKSRTNFASFFADHNGLQQGTFNIPDNVISLSNDHVYQDAA